MKKSSTLEIPHIKLKKKDAQFFIKFIKNRFQNRQIINQKYKILHKDEYLLFPIMENALIIKEFTTSLKNNIEFDLIYKEAVFNENYRFKTLQEALIGKIPESLLDLIPKSYDIIGNIAIIEFDKFNRLNDKQSYECKKETALAITTINKNVKTVYEKKSEIKGPYRLRELDLLYGDDKSETIHKENNCVFKLDVKKTYFSPRLVFERRRIASSEIEENGLIVDMFAGVGTFSIQIAKNRNVKIYAFDVNPDANEYLKENIDLNKLKGDIIPNNIDVKKLLDPTNKLGHNLFHNADRIIVNLPEISINFIDVICFLMKKSGGILHFYQFSEKPNPIKKAIKTLEAELASYNWEIDFIINSKVVKHFSPKSELVVVDLKIKASNE
jgi:tRNA (guanine37-N1)-methyltransferase